MRAYLLQTKVESFHHVPHHLPSSDGESAARSTIFCAQRGSSCARLHSISSSHCASTMRDTVCKGQDGLTVVGVDAHALRRWQIVDAPPTYLQQHEGDEKQAQRQTWISA